VRLSFEQAMDGAQVAVTVPKQARCETCGGSGAAPGTSPITCPRCEGRGQDVESQGFFSIAQPCPQCGGRGEIVEEPCKACAGAGVTRQRKRYRVNVPAGVRDGTRIRLAGKGEDGPLGGTSGDLFVTTRVARSPVFTRREDGGLEVEVPITISEAIGGGNIEVPTLRGTKRIRIPAGTRDGSVQRLRGEGPPKPGSRDRGEIRYRMKIDVPTDLSTEQKRALENFSKTLDGRDPRERILREARLRAETDRSDRSGKVGAS
jgi:molecular chaperone DnaJ